MMATFLMLYIKMPYFYDTTGRLNSMTPLVNFQTPSQQQQRAIKADNIRTHHVYLESTETIEPGHVVEWTGEPAMFLADGKRKENFDHNFALSSIRAASDYSTTVAGIVTEKAAETGDYSFTHKGIHTTHLLPQDLKKLYRVGRDVQIAWVIDDSMNEIEGVYQRYVNGTLDTTGPYQLSMISNDVFSIDRTIAASIEQELSTLRARFDALTTSSE